jgi:small subunit ribosomal protein S20
MPQHESAKKRLRQSARQRLRNRGYRTDLRKVIKAVREDSGVTVAAQSAVDTAVRRGIIHPNKAARLKSRFAKAQQAAATA